MKKILSIISLVLCAISTIFTFTYGIYHLKNEKENISKDYKCILTLWHVDTFEGGTGSRKQFLHNIAKDFEKKNKGVFIMVTSYTIEGVKEQLNKGNLPDIISYGNGIEINNLSEINCKVCFSAGVMNNKNYAIPWCKGGYVLIKNKGVNEQKNKNIIVSSGEYAQPILALLLELEKGEINKEFSSDFNSYKLSILPQKQAYENFVVGKSKYLIGTQRDVIRLTNREVDFEVYSFTQFNDLYQYISTITNKPENKFYADLFINYLLEENQQKKLTQISMFSNYFNLGYENVNYSKIEKTVNTYTISPFLTSVELGRIKTLSLQTFNGEKEEINNIKKMLFCLEKNLKI